MGLSPFQQQYEWERHNSPDRRLDGSCTACNAMTQWGWCPNCTPIHYKDLP